MVEIRTHSSDGAVFLCNLSAFLLRFPWLKSSNFLNAHAILLIIPPTNVLHVECHLFSIAPKQLTCHFHWVFCLIYETGAYPEAFSLRDLCPVYFGKEVYILLCYPCNSWSMLKESSYRYPTLGFLFFYSSDTPNSTEETKVTLQNAIKWFEPSFKKIQWKS